MQEQDNLKLLFDKWYTGAASPEEIDALHVLLNDAENIKILRQYSRRKWDEMMAADIDWSASPDNMINRILTRSAPDEAPRIRRMNWFRYAAAILVLLSVGMYLWQHNTPVVPSITTSANIKPGGKKATLTLANGATVVLDDATNGHLARQGNVNVIKLQEGTLSYSKAGAASADGMVLYNTISTPKGGQYQVELPDGSQVWLNAASSVRFPVSFTGNERDIEVHGEVYVEVKKDAQKPFTVSANGFRVEVLGTSFNINTFTDEPAARTTLIAGSIRIKAGNTSQALRPGQQAEIDKGMRILNDVDIEKVIAWKNGYFNFENVDLVTAMKQLQRWYDIDVVYEKNIPPIYFVGKIKMDMSLKDVLKILEASDVHFRVENNRRLIVMP